MACLPQADHPLLPRVQNALGAHTRLHGRRGSLGQGPQQLTEAECSGAPGQCDGTGVRAGTLLRMDGVGSQPGRQTVAGVLTGPPRPRARRQGRLADCTVLAPTRRRYDHALRLFFRYLDCYMMPLPADKVGLDGVAAAFLQYLYNEGYGKQIARDFGAGLQDALPHVRRKLPTLWRWMGAWDRLEPPKRAPAVPAHVAVALAACLLLAGRPDAATLILVAFHCLLRTNEAVSLTRKQVCFGTDRTAATIALESTKTSRRKHAVEAVSCTDPLTVAALRQACFALAPGDRLLRTHPSSFRTLFAEAVAALGVKRFAFRPYSLRRGGATHEMRQRGSMEHVLERGRWSSTASARIYIQDAVATAVAIELTAKERLEVSQLCAAAARAWRQTPAAPGAG